MSSDPVADEFWTRTTPAAVAAPSELNVIVGPAVMREPFSSVRHPLASVSAPVKTLPPGHGTTVPEQDRIRLFGFVCDSVLKDTPRVTASWRAWFSCTTTTRAAPSVSWARVAQVEGESDRAQDRDHRREHHQLNDREPGRGVPDTTLENRHSFGHVRLAWSA
jgi:hypothetical protein